MDTANESYKPVFKHRVYSRNETLTSGPREIALTHLVTLCSYTEPSDDEVITYLQQKERDVAATSRLFLPRGAVEDNKSPLEQVLLALPDQVRRDLRSNNQDLLNFIRNNVGAPALQEGESPQNYLQVTYGVLPTELIDKSPDESNKAGWYDAALSDGRLREAGFGMQLLMRLLLEERSFPDRVRMDILLESNAHDSVPLRVSRRRYPAKVAKQVLDVAYDNLSLPDDYAGLTDVSDEVLEAYAFESMLKLISMLKEQSHTERERQISQLPKIPGQGSNGGLIRN